MIMLNKFSRIKQPEKKMSKIKSVIIIKELTIYIFAQILFGECN